MRRPMLGIALILALPADRRRAESPEPAPDFCPRAGWSRATCSLPAASARWLAAEGG